MRRFEAFDLPALPLGHLSNSVLARVPLGTWDAALAEQGRLREMLGESANQPPSFASGGHGAHALIHEARGDHAAADAVLAEIDAWMGGGERPRLWSMPQAAVALARRGDYIRARALLSHLSGRHLLYRARPLEARCSLAAEERAWADVPGSRRRSAPALRGRPTARASAPRRPAGGPCAARGR